MYDLSLKFKKDEKTAIKYILAKTRIGPIERKIKDSIKCNINCRRDQFCQTSSSDYKEYKEC
jgi:hypothetical protein